MEAEGRRLEIVAEYVYEQADGTPYLLVQRTSGKDFWQRHWTGKDWARGSRQARKSPTGSQNCSQLRATGCSFAKAKRTPIR